MENNKKEENKNDKTQATGKIPHTDVEIGIVFMMLVVIVVEVVQEEPKTVTYTASNGKQYETDIIDPYDNSCTSQLTDGHTEITLITCYNKGVQRFIAKARANNL